MSREGPDGDTVPGMSDAVERRRRHLGLAPGAFAERAGITTQGAGYIRRGARRAYQSDTISGVAFALQWRTDWYDRILDGLAPIEEPPSRELALAILHERRRKLRGELAAIADELGQYE